MANTGATGARLFLLAAAALSLSCHAFERAGPDRPPELNPPAVVDVAIEYRQPNACEPGSPRCDDSVVFFATWMKPGQEFVLTPEPGRFVWRGTAHKVPVNFPPRDEPHYVRVYDPHLVGTPTEGMTASRLTVGGEAISAFYAPGEPLEFGLIYIDANGQGHSPF